MPYELSFRKPVEISDRDTYINECCIGGDVVSNAVLPSIRERYDDIQANQEDWGWFIWFAKGGVRLAVDIFCDDPDTGAFRIHLTSRARRFLLPDRVVDTPELEDLRGLIVAELERWGAAPVSVERLDPKYMALDA